MEIPREILYRVINDLDLAMTARVAGRSSVDDLVTSFQIALLTYEFPTKVTWEQVQKLAAARMVRTLGASLWHAQPAELKECVYHSVAEELIMVGLDVAVPDPTDHDSTGNEH
jgi:hypothetical protein